MASSVNRSSNHGSGCSRGNRYRNGHGSVRSSLPVSVVYKGKRVRCECGLNATIRVSSIDTNPRRLFFSCPRFWIKVDNEEISHCPFFKWVDNVIVEEDKISIRAPSINHEDVMRNLTSKMMCLECEVRKLMLCVVMITIVTIMRNQTH